MGTTNDFGLGWLMPTLSYLTACVGVALGLRCALRALAATGPSRRNWLLTAAAAIGSGIWTMHFIAMFGFTVDGTQPRCDVPLIFFSLVIAVLVVGLGVFTVGYGRHRTRSLFTGGLITGVGIGAMHFVGLAAARVHSAMVYDPRTVGLSVVIAIGAATVALWAAVTIRNPVAAGGAALVMGIAVSCMHYTGMAAVNIHLHPAGNRLGGATPMEFVFPLAVGLGSFLFLTSAFVALSPTAPERAAYREAGELAVEDLRSTELDRVA